VKEGRAGGSRSQHAFISAERRAGVPSRISNLIFLCSIA